MGHHLTDTSLPALAAAVEQSRSEMLRNYGRSPLAELYDGPDLLRVYTGIPEPFFNGVLRARMAPDQVPAAVAAATAYFSARRIIWSWVVASGAASSPLEERLQACGLAGAHAGIAMGADLQAIPEGRPAPPGLEMVRVDSAETLAAFTQTYVTGFGMADAVRSPFAAIERSLGWDGAMPYRRYLGLLGGQPVATTALFLGESAAGVYHVSTVPAARRQGIGTAMVRRALSDARAAGYRVAVLHASEAGSRVYRSLGFRACGLLREYVPASETTGVHQESLHL